MEDKIEVGEYVRTKFSIGKVKSIGIDENLIYFKNYECLKCTHKKDIVKHSKNIIDLIEEGDYVNGHKIIMDLEQSKKHYNSKDNFVTAKGYTFEENEIKSIVTHEQFLSIEYKITKED